jgi:hypothetical protein
MFDETTKMIDKITKMTAKIYYELLKNGRVIISRR